jgi:hypothetical protein
LLEKLEQWQTDSGAVARKFRWEWNEFGKLHRKPVPLVTAKRMDWLARLIERLPPEADVKDEHWAEIRATAKEARSTMKPDS